HSNWAAGHRPRKNQATGNWRAKRNSVARDRLNCPAGSVAIRFCIERPVDWNTQIFGLLRGELCKLDADFFEMQARDFFVEFFWQDVNADFIGVPVFPQI